MALHLETCKKNPKKDELNNQNIPNIPKTKILTFPSRKNLVKPNQNKAIVS
jgi:hypothetical protein